MKLKGFAGFHPVVNFTYFVFVIAFSMIFMHPFCLVISLFCALFHLFSIKGIKTFKNILFILFIILSTAIINPLFSHQGVTILTYFPNGTPLTAESIFCGLGAGVMLSGVILHFSCFNMIFTSDKFIYLFGKTIPSVALIISMTLNFVPKFKRRINAVTATQKCIGKGYDNKNLISKIKCGLNILSVTTTHALENSIDTSDSMKARGYGLPKRTTYSNFKFTMRDTAVLCIVIILGTYIIFSSVANQLDFFYYPMIKSVKITKFSISSFVSYFLLCVTPVILNIKEAIIWKFLKSKN